MLHLESKHESRQGTHTAAPLRDPVPQTDTTTEQASFSQKAQYAYPFHRGSEEDPPNQDSKLSTQHSVKVASRGL